MKRRKITLLLVLLCSVSFSADAQISARIAALRSRINSQITTATGFRSVTAANHGNILDSMMAISNDMNASANLQTVLGVGNSADISINLTTGALLDVSGAGTDRAQVGPGQLLLWSASGGGFYGRLYSNITTANKNFYLPNFASGNSTDDALVTHKSNASVSVVSGTDAAVVAATQFSVSNAATDGGALYPNKLLLHEGTGAGSSNASIVSDVITSNHVFYLPDYTTGNASDDALVTHRTGQAITVVGGVNIASMAPAAFSMSNTSTSDASVLSPNNITFHDGANSGSVFTNLTGSLLPGAAITHQLNQYGGMLLNKYGGSVTVNPGGAASINVAHGLPFTPSIMFFTPKNVAASQFFAQYYAAYGASNMVITSALLLAVPIDYDWIAIP